MATLYKNRNIWYITVSNGNNRLTRSLRTKDKQVAKQLKPSVELELLSQLSGATQPSKNLPFDELVRCYLKADHNWSKRTKELNEYVFRSYQSGKPLPPNPTTRAIFSLLSFLIHKQKTPRMWGCYLYELILVLRY